MRRWWAACLFAVGLSGCRSAERVAHDVLRATPQGRKLLPAFARYRKVAHILRKYHDSGVLDENGDRRDSMGAILTQVRCLS